MTEVIEVDYRTLLPYQDRDIPALRDRLLKHPLVPNFVKEFFPGLDLEIFRKKMVSVSTVGDFQSVFIRPSIESIFSRTTTGVTISGLDGLDKRQTYLFLSNHRDIVLDPAIFATLLHQRGFRTPKVCLGDNLLKNDWITDLVKANKGITVKRGLQQSQLMRWSIALSKAIRNEIESGTDSVWIAQREGRAKDGNDLTHPGVVKMLCLASGGGFIDALKSLRMVPAAISYEFDPCDDLKAREVVLTQQDGKYDKAPDEDRRSMARGIFGRKGRIHLFIGSELNIDGLVSTQKTRPLQVKAAVSEIDRQIHCGFKNWPSNYLAYDLLKGTKKYADRYDSAYQTLFLDRMDQRLEKIGLPAEANRVAREAFLTLYAKSVENAESYLPPTKVS